MNPAEDSPSEGESKDNAVHPPEVETVQENKPDTPDQETLNPEMLQLLTKHYTDQFWSTLGRTSVFLIAWIGALLVIFIDPILPLPQEALKQKKSILEIKRQQTAAKAKQFEAGRERAVRAATESRELRPIVDEDSQTPDTQVEVRTLPRSQPTSSPTPTPDFQEQRQQAASSLSKLRTPLGELNIRPIFAPLIWSVLFAGLLAFFLQRRIVLIALLAKVIQLRMLAQTDNPQVIRGLGSWTPFWLAPLPKAIGDSVLSEGMLRAYLGWEDNERWRSALTHLCIGVALAAHLAVVFIATLLVRASQDPGQMAAICFAVYGVFLACLLAVFAWLRPRIKLGSFPMGFLQIDRQRRWILRGAVSLAVVGSVAAVVTALLPTRVTKRVLLKLSGVSLPRLRSKVPAVAHSAFTNSFRRHLSSSVIHYFGHQGLASNRVFLSPKNVELIPDQEVISRLSLTGKTLQESKTPPSWPELPVNLGPGSASKNKKKAPRLNVSQAPALIECLAMEQCARGDRSAALSLLRSAIVLDASRKERLTKKIPSYRLYDLYVGLAYSMNDSLAIQDLIAYARAKWQKDKRMEKRVERWSSPRDEYLKKWRGPNLPWSAPWPKDRTRYNGRCK